METEQLVTIGGNEAAAWIAHRLNEVIAIYPITSTTPIGKHAEQCSTDNRPTSGALVPHIIPP